MGLSGFRWKVVIVLLLKLSQIYPVCSAATKTGGKADHCKKILSRKTLTNVSIHAKLPSIRFNTKI